MWISSRATSEMPAEPASAGDSAAGAGAPAKERRECRSADWLWVRSRPRQGRQATPRQGHPKEEEKMNAACLADSH
jgi:hypothetical protein